MTCNAAPLNVNITLSVPNCPYNTINQEDYNRYPILQRFNNNNPLSDNNHDLNWYKRFINNLLDDVQKFNDNIFVNNVYNDNSDPNGLIRNTLKYMFYGIIGEIYSQLLKHNQNNTTTNLQQFVALYEYALKIATFVFWSDQKQLNFIAKKYIILNNTN